MIYMLEHQSTGDHSLGLNALGARDLIKVKAIQGMCRENYLCLYIVTLERTLVNSIVGEYLGYGFKYDDTSDDMSGECSCDETDCGDCFNLDPEADTIIGKYHDDYMLKRVVDLDGKLVAPKLKVERCQITQADVLEAWRPGKKKKEDLKRGRATATFTYTRSVSICH